MKKNSTLFLVALGLLLNIFVQAQCPGSIAATATTTSASCPSNGSVIINTTPAANPSFLYTLTAGPSGALLNAAQSSNTFNALLPGSYTANVTCGTVQANVNFTIANAYTPLSVTASASATCSGYAPGGTVTITATGGSTPLTYSIIKSNDPNYSDASSVYNSSSVKTVNSYGTYQVRVKDACNQFYTTTVQLSPSLNPVKISLGSDAITGCSPTTYTFYCALLDVLSSQEIDSVPYNALGGVKMRVYEQAAASCAPAGPLLSDIHAPTHSRVTIPVVSSKKYFIQIITPCGDTTADCFDASQAENPFFSMYPVISGCGTVANPLLEMITPASWASGIVYPLTIKLYRGTNATGTFIGTRTVNTIGDIGTAAAQFQGLTPDTYYMESTDACGHVNTQIITDLTSAGSPWLQYEYDGTSNCTGAGITTQSGALTAAVSLQGFLANVSTAKAVIIAGPTGIGDTARTNGSVFIWINLIPGTYTAAITTSCGTINLQFTIPPTGPVFLKQNISATAAFACSAGSGSITATTDYNGALSPSYVLVNASTNMGVDSNSTGNFVNIPSGQYYVRLKLTNNSSCTNTKGYYINGNNVTIASSVSGPQIAKKLGVTCEDVNGNPQTTGTAYLSLAGAPPFLLEYKLTSSSTWITWSANAPAETTVEGLVAGSIYDIRVTSCGITNATQVTIGQIGKVHASNSVQPCAGSPFELAMPQLAGATYQWKNASGTVLSTTYNYTFPSYSSVNNGKYVGIVTWGSCVVRTDTVTLNSSLCGQIMTLPVKLSAFTASAQNCAVALSWKVSEQVNTKDYKVERSNDGRLFVVAGIVPAAQTTEYRFTDNTLQAGNIYYRLKMEDNDGYFSYSNTIALKARCNSIGTQWSVQPSLAKRGGTVVIKMNASANITAANIIVTNATGQQVYTYYARVLPGINNFTIPSERFAAGVYFIAVSDNNGQHIGAIEKLVLSTN